MKITLTVPEDLVDLVDEALASGEYESREQILRDALYLWAELAESEDGLDDEDVETDESDLLAAMEAKARGEG